MEATKYSRNISKSSRENFTPQWAHLFQIIFHPDHFIFHLNADPYFTLTILSPSTEFNLGSNFTLIRILPSQKFHPEPNFTPSKISRWPLFKFTWPKIWNYQSRQNWPKGKKRMKIFRQWAIRYWILQAHHQRWKRRQLVVLKCHAWILYHQPE